MTPTFYLDGKNRSPRCLEPDELREVLHKIAEVCVLSHLDPALAVEPLMCSMLLVIAFEATNELHDAANVLVTVLIGVSGFTGPSASTTHIVTPGISGTMVTSGAGLRMLSASSSRGLGLAMLVGPSVHYLLDAPSSDVDRDPVARKEGIMGSDNNEARRALF